VSGSDAFSAGRHLLTVGAMGLSIYMVLNIAGRMHCGRELDERLWVPAGAAALFAAAVVRAATALPGAPTNLLLALSAICSGSPSSPSGCGTWRPCSPARAPMAARAARASPMPLWEVFQQRTDRPFPVFALSPKANQG
jgi:hypothetical protein